MLEQEFLQKLLENMAGTVPFTIHILNEADVIIASTKPERINETTIHITPEGMVYSLDVGPTTRGWKIVIGDNSNYSAMLFGVIKSSYEAFMEVYVAGLHDLRAVGQEERIVKELFYRGSPYQEEIKLIGHLKRAGLNVGQPRIVILIEFENKANRYFNINLDLGYEASAETIKSNVIETIKENRYLTSQDIVARFGDNQIVVIKAFLNVEDIERIYLATDRICQSIYEDLESSNIFALRIAYGNIYRNLSDLVKSYEEAQTILSLGKTFLPKTGLNTWDDLLIEYSAANLPPVIVDRLVKPTLNKLKRKDGTVDMELLHVAEQFVDEGLNLGRTALKTFLHRNTVTGKIEKYKSITGLDPTSSFQHAFITKLAAVYVRLNYPGIK